MKNAFFIIPFLAIAFINNSCSKSSDCDFIGEWCIDYGSGPCIDPGFGIMTAAELNIKSNGELIFAGSTFDWESDNCKTINLTQDNSPEKSVWTITLDGDQLFLDFGVGFIQDFTRKN
jgi:hypothetical protein